MKRSMIGLAIALAALPLTACVEDGYGSGGLFWSSYPYSGYYDDYYGSIYDGYWGTDNFFYYRRSDQDHRYYRDQQQDFRRGGAMPGGNFHRHEGTNEQPRRGTRMPHFPRGEHQGGGHGRGSRQP
jgi:hypothetical protein